MRCSDIAPGRVSGTARLPDTLKILRDEITIAKERLKETSSDTKSSLKKAQAVKRITWRLSDSLRSEIRESAFSPDCVNGKPCTTRRMRMDSERDSDPCPCVCYVRAWRSLTEAYSHAKDYESDKASSLFLFPAELAMRSVENLYMELGGKREELHPLWKSPDRPQLPMFGVSA